MPSKARTRSGASSRDAIDAYLRQWRAVRPDVATDALAVSGRVARLAHGFHRLITPVLARHDLEPWAYDVLATVRRSDAAGGLSMGELTKHLLLAAGSTTHRVDQLVRRKLVARKADPSSRRRVLISLTAKGRQTIDAVLPELADRIGAALSTIPAKDRRAIDAALRTALRALEEALRE